MQAELPSEQLSQCFAFLGKVSLATVHALFKEMCERLWQLFLHGSAYRGLSCR